MRHVVYLTNNERFAAAEYVKYDQRHIVDLWARDERAAQSIGSIFSPYSPVVAHMMERLSKDGGEWSYIDCLLMLAEYFNEGVEVSSVDDIMGTQTIFDEEGIKVIENNGDEFFNAAKERMLERFRPFTVRLEWDRIEDECGFRHHAKTFALVMIDELPPLLVELTEQDGFVRIKESEGAELADLLMPNAYDKLQDIAILYLLMPLYTLAKRRLDEHFSRPRNPHLTSTLKLAETLPNDPQPLKSGAALALVASHELTALQRLADEGAKRRAREFVDDIRREFVEEKGSAASIPMTLADLTEGSHGERPIARGDVVRLIGGSIPMTVTDLLDKGMVDCAYEKNGKPRRFKTSLDSICIVSPPYQRRAPYYFCYYRDDIHDRGCGLNLGDISTILRAFGLDLFVVPDGEAKKLLGGVSQEGKNAAAVKVQPSHRPPVSDD